MAEDQRVEIKTESSAPPVRETRRMAPYIFISHDSRDHELAEKFSRLLTQVSAGLLKSFRSSDKKGMQGIEFGLEWYPELMKNLALSSDVVCLLTPNSVGRPWILYEAGVAKGKLDASVFGIALGVPLNDASVGPFAQFQNSADDEESLTTLVVQLLRRIPDAEPDREAVRMQVSAFKAGVDEVLNASAGRATEETPEEADTDQVVKIFEEIKLMYQQLPSKIDRRVGRSISGKLNEREFSYYLDHVREISFRDGEPTSCIVGLGLISSLMKEQIPLLEGIFEQLQDSMRRENSSNYWSVFSLLHRMAYMIEDSYMARRREGAVGQEHLRIAIQFAEELGGRYFGMLEEAKPDPAKA